MTRGRGWIVAAALVVGGTGIAAVAQRGGFGPGFGGGPGPGGPGRVVTGEPFTASSTSTSIEKLADGTTITHKSTSTEARDAEGRTVRATTLTEGSGTTVTRTSVLDPVAHTMTTWSTVTTTAMQMQLPAGPGGARAGWAGGPGGPKGDGPGPGGPRGAGPGGVRPQVTRVDLTPKTIDGVNATGVKTTMTILAGAQGNDKPLVSTREVWTATDLKVVLLEISDSPRDGFHKMEVTALTPGAPDPTLFQVPSNYTLTMETRRHGM